MSRQGQFEGLRRSLDIDEEDEAEGEEVTMVRDTMSVTVMRTPIG